MQATAEISQSALSHNLSLVRDLCDESGVVSMIKADAYGHQLALITPIINDSDFLAVSELSEAKKLREKTKKPILLLSGVYSQEELQSATNLGCHIVVHEKQQISLMMSAKVSTNVWIKIDTGMHRLGLLANEYHQSIEFFKTNPLINIECVMSHFACADEIDNPMNKTQLNEFNQLTDNSVKRSMANSATILSNKEALFDFVRPGIMLYGISPFGQDDKTLKPVMQLSAPIVSIKTIQTGESVGYGATWTAEKETIIAIIGIGYGDGYPRHAKNGTPVCINNELCPLIGRVSMDLICVDISNIKADVGDIAILWGNDKISAETVAAYSNTIGYELVTGLSSRVRFTQTA